MEIVKRINGLNFPALLFVLVIEIPPWEVYMLNSHLRSAGYTPARAFVCLAMEVLLGSLMAACGAQLAMVILFFLLTLGLGLFLLWPRKSVAIIALALLASFSWGLWRKADLRPQDDDLSLVRARQVTLLGQVEELREHKSESGDRLSMTVRPHLLLWPYRSHLSGRVLVEVEAADTKPFPGDTVELSGAVECPPSRRFSFQFDESAWLTRQGIFCRMQCQKGQVHIVRQKLSAEGSGLDKIMSCLSAYIESLRRGIVHKHNEILGNFLGPLFSSIVLGDRVVAVDVGLKKEFARIGLSHLLAASGLNLTIIVASALALCRFLNKTSGGGEAFVSFVCVLSFTALAGSGPSVNRAAIMCLTALWARLTFVRLEPGVSLALALLVAILLDPGCVLDIGLQLSYAATFGIIYIFPAFDEAFLKRIPAIRPWRCLRPVASLLAVVLCAQLAVLPVQLVNFRQLPLLVLPANLLAEPVVMPLTVLGFISSICAVFEKCTLIGPVFCWICLGLDCLAKYLLLWLTFLSHTLAAFPQATVLLAAPKPVHIICYYITLFLVLSLGRPRLTVYALIGAAALLALISYLRTPLLEVFCSGDQVVVNRGNRSFFIYSIKNKARKSAYCSYLRHLGIAEQKAPELVGDSFFLDREELAVTVTTAQSLSLSALTISSRPPAGRQELTVTGPGGHCRCLGSAGGRILPYLDLKLWSMPWWVHLEKSKNAVWLSLSLL